MIIEKVVDRFMDENTGRGNLNIKASFANQALPITNLRVIVSKEIEREYMLVQFL